MEKLVWRGKYREMSSFLSLQTLLHLPFHSFREAASAAPSLLLQDPLTQGPAAPPFCVSSCLRGKHRFQRAQDLPVVLCFLRNRGQAWRLTVRPAARPPTPPCSRPGPVPRPLQARLMYLLK